MKRKRKELKRDRKKEQMSEIEDERTKERRKK